MKVRVVKKDARKSDITIGNEPVWVYFESDTVEIDLWDFILWAKETYDYDPTPSKLKELFEHFILEATNAK
jgi:hypothetical protein